MRLVKGCEGAVHMMTVLPQPVDVFDGFHIVPTRLHPVQVLRFDTALTTPWKAIGEREKPKKIIDPKIPTSCSLDIQ